MPISLMNGTRLGIKRTQRVLSPCEDAAKPRLPMTLAVDPQQALHVPVS